MTKKTLGKPRQIRLPKKVEKDLQDIADANGIGWSDATRIALIRGLEALKGKFGEAVKKAA